MTYTKIEFVHWLRYGRSRLRVSNGPLAGLPNKSAFRRGGRHAGPSALVLTARSEAMPQCTVDRDWRFSDNSRRRLSLGRAAAYCQHG